MDTLSDRDLQWRPVCQVDDLVAQSGVVALVGGEQVALFYLPHLDTPTVFAVGNRDPRSGANVIGRGLVGQVGGHLVVSSPLYKQQFRLHDGVCLQDDRQRLPTWRVRIQGDAVEIA